MKVLETIKDHIKDLERMEGVFTFYGCFNSASECKKANKELTEAIAELEALQQPKRCDGCWYGKTTINSVICGKSGTYKEADDYCKYYNPKE